MAKHLACWFGWHKWVRRSTPDGGKYLQCLRCGVDDGDSKVVPGAGAL